MTRVKASILQRAAVALVQYQGNDREALTDLLTDLRHWCDAHELDFTAADQMAQVHHASEQGI